MPTLLAACVVNALLSDRGNGATAIDKRPVPGAVKVGRYGLFADVQVDRRHHGGLDQAIYAYAQDDADFWQSELGRPLLPGWFGENLRVSGIDVNAARVGERWRVGSTVELEVMSPRTPCATFARWVGGADARGWVKRFSEEGRLGAYLRVAKTGTVEARDDIEVLSVPEHAQTMLELFRS
jgi:MOSC domain-containing protein YiiM